MRVIVLFLVLAANNRANVGVIQAGTDNSGQSYAVAVTDAGVLSTQLAAPVELDSDAGVTIVATQPIPTASAASSWVGCQKVCCSDAGTAIPLLSPLRAWENVQVQDQQGVTVGLLELTDAGTDAGLVGYDLAGCVLGGDGGCVLPAAGGSVHLTVPGGQQLYCLSPASQSTGCSTECEGF